MSGTKKKYHKKKNAILLYFENPFKWTYIWSHLFFGSCALKLNSMRYESTKHGAQECSRYHPLGLKKCIRIPKFFPRNLTKYLYNMEIPKENEFWDAVDTEAVVNGTNSALTASRDHLLNARRQV